MHENKIGKVSIEEVEKIIEKEGKKGWCLAKKTILDHKECAPQFREALNYLTLIPDFFRPAMVSLCCKAVGGDPDITIPTGASFVLLSKAVGIHDDIIDDVKRRGKHITFYGKFGRDLALVFSDVLFFKGFTLLRKNLEIGVSPSTANEILKTINNVWCYEQSCSEFMEIKSKGRWNVSLKKCLNKIRMRASELETITRAGGILGGGSEKEIESLGSYGRLIGTASILRDELIDMLEFDVLKHRIRNESLPLPLIYATRNSEVCPKILSILRKKILTIDDLEKITEMTKKAGGLDFVIEQIEDVTSEAISYINAFNIDQLIRMALSINVDQKELGI